MMRRVQNARPLSAGEIGLARSIFGSAIDYAAIRIHRGRWWPFQRADVVMAPDGDIWFPAGLWRADFAFAPFALKTVFIHEMTHVWQAQRSGRWWLPLMRHPFCRYRYRLIPGKPFERYGIEQQAEIVAHAWAAKAQGDRAGFAAYSDLLPFRA